MKPPLIFNSYGVDPPAIKPTGHPAGHPRKNRAVTGIYDQNLTSSKIYIMKLLITLEKGGDGYLDQNVQPFQEVSLGVEQSKKRLRT